MLKGDISNERSFVIGFRAEGTLFKIKDGTLLDRVLNLFRGGKLKRAEMNLDVFNTMFHLYMNTEYTVALIINEGNYKDSDLSFLEDLPFNVIYNTTTGGVTSMLNTGELSYFIENNAYERSLINSRYCISLEEFNKAFRKKFITRVTL